MHNLTVEGKVGTVRELKRVGETSVLNFTLASSEYSGKKDNQTVWFSCSVWGQYAESIAPHIEKGKGLMVIGRLEYDDYGNPRVYTTQEGQPRANFSLRVDRMSFTSKATGQVETQTTDDTDDIPF